MVGVALFTVASLVCGLSQSEGMLIASRAVRLLPRGRGTLVARCVEELTKRGRPELAARVRHVSLISDQLGYDVVSPTLAARDVRLEVKTSRRVTSPDASFFISRNEARAGAHDAQWRLVICQMLSDERLEVLGSCSHSVLGPLLPADTARSQWTTSDLRVPIDRLAPGLSFLS
jgi:hypothetical protein